MDSSQTVFKRPWDRHSLANRLKKYIENNCDELSYCYGKQKVGGKNF